MKKMDIGNIFWWAETQRLLVTIRLENGSQYEIDGRLFREGVYSVVFENGKKTERVKILDFYLLPKVGDDDIEGIWIDVPKRFWGYWSMKTVLNVLEGLMKNYPEKTPGRKLKEYIDWIPSIFRLKQQKGGRK